MRTILKTMDTWRLTLNFRFSVQRIYSEMHKKKFTPGNIFLFLGAEYTSRSERNETMLRPLVRVISRGSSLGCFRRTQVDASRSRRHVLSSTRKTSALQWSSASLHTSRRAGARLADVEAGL